MPIERYHGSISTVPLKEVHPMKHTILAPDYEAIFIDDRTLPPSTPFLLRGLGAAIQDSHPDWRPKLSELVSLIRGTKQQMDLVNAGGAYGAAKQIKNMYPGPSLLLFGAAVNAIGKLQDVELNKSINNAQKKLERANMLDDVDIKTTLISAKERASFEKVSEMLRHEFTEGLKRTKKYNDAKIDEAVKKIVKITHSVRHGAVIDRYGWAKAKNDQDRVYICDSSSITESNEFTDIFSQITPNDMLFGKSFFQELIPYAQDGCAQAILLRLEILRDRR